MGAVFKSITSIGEGIFNTIDSSNLKHEWQDFKMKLAEQEQVFSDNLHLTTQEQENANAVTKTNNDFYLSVNAQSQNQSTKYLIAAGVVAVLGIGVILILKKNN